MSVKEHHDSDITPIAASDGCLCGLPVTHPMGGQSITDAAISA